MKKSKALVFLAANFLLSLMFSTVAFAAQPSTDRDTIIRIEEQVNKINKDAPKNVTSYKRSLKDVTSIEPIKIKPELVLDTDILTDSDFDFYEAMTDQEIYTYLTQRYNTFVAELQESNNYNLHQLEQQILDVSEIKSHAISPRATAGRSHIFNAPITQALGFVKMKVTYNVTYSNNRFTSGTVTNCEEEDYLSLARWTWESSHTYPLIETNNGEYIAFQVTGYWLAGFEHGIGSKTHAWYDFSDSQPY